MKAALLVLLLFGFQVPGWADSAAKKPEPEGLSPAALAAADDTLSECVELSDVKLLNGESVADYARRRGITPAPPSGTPRLKPKAPAAVGGQALSGDPVSLRRTIDGPANLRDAPGGKVLYSFENGHAVLLLGQAKDWYLVRSYSARPCESGWTHRKNILPYGGARP